MITDMEKRRYTLKKRAEQREDTRDRIVEAIMALHEEVGPRHTSVSAIAERAGVQRLTVYRHFPDEQAMFQACGSTWIGRNPPPDPGTWDGIDDPVAQVEHALRELYPYYRRTRQMWNHLYRDADDMPGIREQLQEIEGYLDQVAAGLNRSWGKKTSVSLQRYQTLRHVVGFRAWQSLADQGLDDRAMAELVKRWVQGARQR